jgi:D-aspartate ligase
LIPTSLDRRRAAVVLAAGTNGLGVVRGLCSKGIDAIVACRSRVDPSYLSRLPAGRTIIPPGVDLLDWLSEFSKTNISGADCIISTSDEFTSALRNLSSASHDCLPCILPPEDLVELLNDKKSEVELISGIGVPVPESVLDLRNIHAETIQLRFPLIIKPRTYRDLRKFGFKNKVVRDRAELDGFLAKHESYLDNFITQEVIPGNEECLWVCNATFDGMSRMISAFTFQRLGTKPYMYGVTSFAVSRDNPEVKDLCRRIAQQLRYSGPVMFEFKLDPRSGQYCYIEINPRLGMCNWFDTRCGVNNVFNTYALTVGIPPEENVDCQIDGVTYLDLAYDLSARVQAKQPLGAIIRHYSAHRPRRLVFPAWYWRDPTPILSLPLRLLMRTFRILRRVFANRRRVANSARS